MIDPQEISELLVKITLQLARIEAKLGIHPDDPAPTVGPRRCRARWKAGIIQGPDAPPDGARCVKLADHHLNPEDAECSYR